MKNLVEKLEQLEKADYDKKVFNKDEIREKLNNQTARSLQLCEEFGIGGADLLISELIHSKDELAELKADKPGFREQGRNDEKIVLLLELVAELENTLRVTFNSAENLKRFKEREEEFAEALAKLSPIADKMKEIEKGLKDNSEAIRIVSGGANTIGINNLDADAFQTMVRVSHQGEKL